MTDVTSLSPGKDICSLVRKRTVWGLVSTKVKASTQASNLIHLLDAQMLLMGDCTCIAVTAVVLQQV